jgi:hypothetical protein
MKMRMTNDQFSGPLFVVGLWRSGTSLLYTLLNQHSQIALTYESDLFLLRSLFRGGAHRDWIERWEFWNSAPSRHGIDRESLPADSPDYPSVAEFIWKQHAGNAIYGDKSPNYYDSMRKLAQIFPHARFIVIWRDLADTCRSIVRAAEGSSYFAKRGMVHRAILGNRRMKRESDALVQAGVPLHQIQYEELIDSPETVMQGVCWFLQIPFDRRMAALTGADVSAIFDAPQHAGVKTTKIGIKKVREEVLSTEQLEKIARYNTLWKKQSKGAWPVYPRRCDTTPVGLIGRTRDAVFYHYLRVFDRFTAFAYCHVPVSWLRRYRGGREPLPPAKSVQSTPAPPQVEEVSTRS